MNKDCLFFIIIYTRLVDGGRAGLGLAGRAGLKWHGNDNTAAEPRQGSRHSLSKLLYFLPSFIHPISPNVPVSSFFRYRGAALASDLPVKGDCQRFAQGRRSMP